MGGNAGLLLLVLLALVAGCATPVPPRPRAYEDAYDVTHYAKYASMDPTTRGVAARKPRHWGRWLFMPKISRPARPKPPHPKMNDRMREWLVTRRGTRDTLFVTFRETMRLPRFPSLPGALHRSVGTDSAAVDSLLRETRTVISQITAQRASRYFDESDVMSNRYNATTLRRYWVLNALLVEMPIDSVPSLIQRRDVVYVRPWIGSGPPQSATGTGKTVLDARKILGTDAYRSLMEAGTGWIAILDTGARASHVLLGGGSGWRPFCWSADCMVEGECDTSIVSVLPACQTSLGCPDCDRSPEGHGTSTAGILVGNSALGDTILGLTEASLDCFIVYDSRDSLNVDAAVRGFQTAMARGNSVIAAEMDEETAGDVAKAADNAYDAGVAVIAANGNYGGIGEPARGPRVIGVGDAWIDPSGNPHPMTGRPGGSTGDGRIKPDLLAPTYTYAAANTGDEDTHLYTGTSCATPYAAGVALLLRNWMTGSTMGNDVGNVYAQLLLSGDRTGPFGVDAHQGVGTISLPATGTSQWGKSWVSEDNPYTDVYVSVPSGVTRIDAAIWWPEATVHTDAGVEMETHNNLDLEIRTPGFWDVFGSTVAKSESPDGVFEKAGYQSADGTPLKAGWWVLRIRHDPLATPDQTVYWAAAWR